MVGDLVVIDIEPLKDGLVEQSALFTVAAPVQLLGVLQKLQTQLDQPRAQRQVVVGFAQAFSEVLSLVLDLPQLGCDLGLGCRHRLVGGCHQVDQVIFTGVEGAELIRELPVAQPGGTFLIRHDGGDVSTDLRDELRREPDGGVVLLDHLLDA